METTMEPTTETGYIRRSAIMNRNTYLPLNLAPAWSLAYLQAWGIIPKEAKPERVNWKEDGF